MPDSSRFRKWLDDLKSRDPRLYRELQEKLDKRRAATAPVTLERVDLPRAETPAMPTVDIAIETLVREGRPALPVVNNRISGADAVEDTSREMARRLTEAAPVIEPVIPLVGRIDVTNFPGTLDFVGTGWLVDRNIVATNRHVAELIARWEGGKYIFRPGRFGEDLSVSIDYRHELGVTAAEVAPVVRVIWIETDPKKADFALLEVGRRTDGTRPESIPLAERDAEPDTDVVVIGYPARAPSHIIPNQAWMDEIYSGTYDVKRVAPGLMGPESRGWATHDCTTLGGNSGSVVVDMKTGDAVALHFAGLYMIENYAVPISTIRQYLKDRPWQNSGASFKEPPRDPGGVRPVVTPNEVTVTIPITIRLSVGDAAHATEVSVKLPIMEAARSLLRQIRRDGVLTTRPGYLIQGNQVSDTQCIVVAAEPARVADVRARVPQQFGGYPVDVRAASIADQIGETLIEEAAMSISYNDADRTGHDFSFDQVEEDMAVTLHVGPERSWTELKKFLSNTNQKLVSSMYEFHAAHVADALEQELEQGKKLQLVLAPQTRGPNGAVPAGDFDRSQMFDKWESKFGSRFDRIFVPTGNNKLVAKSYHIKVTVRDDDMVWLSSGNWKRASQPLIAQSDLDDPKVTSRSGNREWHVVMKNATLARRFRSHILEDRRQSQLLGGTSESIEDEIMVDVPLAMLEAVELEAAASQVFEPLDISRNVKVKPLLTPDRKGKVYCDAVLKLIRSAKKQLLFQNQYIDVDENSGGLFGELVDALVERSQEIDDVRIILRGTDGFWDHVSELKRRGMDVNQCVRRLTNTHTKGIVVDGKRVLVGSQNWSSLGVTLNRDASLLFDDKDIAGYFAGVFEEDWNRVNELATDESVFQETAPRIAVGPEPPPGFVRMPLSTWLEG